MKILFTDLDGTLLDDQKQISPPLLDALFQTVENGNYLALSSGRPLNSILGLQKKFRLFHKNIYTIAFNGALIYDSYHNQSILEHCVSFEDTRFLLSQAKQHSIHCHTYSDTHIVSERQTKELDFYRTHIHLPLALVDDAVSFLPHTPYKLIAISLEGRKVLSRFQNSITPVIQDRITPVFSNDRYLEFFSKNAGKGNALLSLCRYLDLPVLDSYAVGDEENDLTMLQSAGTGVAVSNANEELKQCADYITKNSNNQDGLLELLQTFHFV